VIKGNYYNCTINGGFNLGDAYKHEDFFSVNISDDQINGSITFGVLITQ
jgi:hypothetical protein